MRTNTKTKYPVTQPLTTLSELDETIRRMAWDCTILRESDAPVYCLLPPDPASDVAIAAAIGVKISLNLKKPVVVNTWEEDD